MFNFYLLLAVLYLFHCGSSNEVGGCFSSEWLESVVMSVAIAKTGFHRELQYTVQYGTVNDVKALIIQKLPSGVYIDEYQLATLRQDTGLEVLLDSKVDLEAPEYLSTGFTALIYLSSSSEIAGKHEVMVPVHARYHRPAETGRTRVRVDIESPKLLIRSDQCKTPSSSHAVMDAPCTFSNESMCSWLEILDLKETGAVSLEIPVGDATQTLTVCAVTVSVTLLSSALLLRAMWKHRTGNWFHKNK